MAKFKFNFKSKRTWKNILAIGMTVVLGIGAIFGITRLADKAKDTHKEISPVYAVGGLATDGKYVETKESIYTKDAFECQGLKITPDFESVVSYEVFFYNPNGQYVGTSGVQTEFYSFDGLMEVQYARIVITPNEDEEVSWYEVNKYARQLTVEVNKEQEFALANYFVVDESHHGKICSYNSETSLFETSDMEGFSYVLVDVTNMDNLVFVYPGTSRSVDYSYMWYDEDNKLINSGEITPNLSEFKLSVPDDAVKLGVIYEIGHEFIINQSF